MSYQDLAHAREAMTTAQKYAANTSPDATRNAQTWVAIANAWANIHRADKS